MNIQDINLLFTYNYWANHLLLSKAAQVTPEQFVAPSTHSFSSLRGTLVHIMDSEIGRRQLLHGLPYPFDPVAADFPTVGAIQQRWDEEERAMWEYLNTLRDEDMTRIIRYEGDAGVLRERVLWHCLFHVVNHGMQHRSEAAALLTTYRQSPGDIDFTLFLNERKI